MWQFQSIHNVHPLLLTHRPHKAWLYSYQWCITCRTWNIHLWVRWVWVSFGSMTDKASVHSWPGSYTDTHTHTVRTQADSLSQGSQWESCIHTFIHCGRMPGGHPRLLEGSPLHTPSLLSMLAWALLCFPASGLLVLYRKHFETS